MSTKEDLTRITTICRLPSHKKEYLCDNINGNGQCGNCDAANIEVRQVILENPEKVLGVRRLKKSVTILRPGGDHPIYLAIRSGTYFKKDPTPSSPKQS